jgi:hypothetical protein
MRSLIEPVLVPVEILSLRPTQITVGINEVEKKRIEWRKRRDGGAFLGSHMVPVVIGPKGTPWLIDHHHLALALHLEGVQHVLVSVVVKLDKLDSGRFMNFMDNRNWLHPYDAKGQRRGYEALPRKVSKLVDDPYRSLAGAVREMGGYAKDATPFAEFLWADFYRAHISTKAAKTCDQEILSDALKLAHSSKAKHLPGWCVED